jgi:hypothetical protein
MNTVAEPAVDRQALLEAIRARLQEADLEQGRPESVSLLMPLIEQRLDALVGIVSRVRAERIEPYLERFRHVVCSACPHQSAHGECEMRVAGQCLMWENLRYIVEAIEAFNGPK